ncbi:PREDICTED: jmjC domain-containing protein 8 isoform X1 [Hipposideros armiger]|uniref:JmjC domain-containing protein 8 isoform X1 n=1 Tax=Hipposideros armiger TaxID=186990 RepID=A0A8B7RT20_HIPAR|nr:PREDICTED: jmjC domain-containing protein 8 isoform X1 [Hipposideros armiger]
MGAGRSYKQLSAFALLSGNAAPSGAGQRRPLPGAVRVPGPLPRRRSSGVCLAAADSWRQGRGRSCCSCSGCWQLQLGPAWRATEGGERRRVAGAGPRFRAARNADRLYLQAAARARYAFSRPVILQGLTDNSRFRALCSRERLLASFGDNVVRLSTANTYSYQKVDIPFQEYVEQLLHPQDPTSLGNDTLYFFGDNNFTEWASLFRHYSPPTFGLLGTTPAYSFGIAGAGTGVPFHWHGPGFSEVIYGRKRWFLYPPEKTPKFHPNKTTLSWLRDMYPALTPSAQPLECTIQPGEVLYFPDRWWHATLNLDTSVFISTFLS